MTLVPSIESASHAAHVGSDAHVFAASAPFLPDAVWVGEVGGGTLMIVAESALGHMPSAAQLRTFLNEVGVEASRPSNDGPRALLDRLFASADRALRASHGHSQDFEGLAVVAVLAIGETVHMAHVGDARGFVVSSHGVRMASRGHQRLVSMIEAGLLSVEEAEADPAAGLLSPGLGLGTEVVVDHSEPLTLAPGDRVVLSSREVSDLASACGWSEEPSAFVSRMEWTAEGGIAFEAVAVLGCDVGRPAAERLSAPNRGTTERLAGLPPAPQRSQPRPGPVPVPVAQEPAAEEPAEGGLPEGTLPEDDLYDLPFGLSVGETDPERYLARPEVGLAPEPSLPPLPPLRAVPLPGFTVMQPFPTAPPEEASLAALRSSVEVRPAAPAEAPEPQPSSRSALLRLIAPAHSFRIHEIRHGTIIDVVLTG